MCWGLGWALPSCNAWHGSLEWLWVCPAGPCAMLWCWGRNPALAQHYWPTGTLCDVSISESELLNVSAVLLSRLARDLAPGLHRTSADISALQRPATPRRSRRSSSACPTTSPPGRRRTSVVGRRCRSGGGTAMMGTSRTRSRRTFCRRAAAALRLRA